MPTVSEPVRDIIGRALYEEPPLDRNWYELSEDRREPWREDADRVVSALWHIADAKALPDPKEGPFLVTNNIKARNAHGRMSHVFLVHGLYESDGPEGPVTGFAVPGGQLLFGITHYQRIEPPAPAPAPACPYCGTTSGLRQVHDGGGFTDPEYTCEDCFTPTDTGPCFDDLTPHN